VGKDIQFNSIQSTTFSQLAKLTIIPAQDYDASRFPVGILGYTFGNCHFLLCRSRLGAVLALLWDVFIV